MKDRSKAGRHHIVDDGSSDLHVMLHVNQRDGFTIAVSEARYISQIVWRTTISEDSLSVLIPLLEEILRWDAPHGLLIQEWDKVRTDWIIIRDG